MKKVLVVEDDADINRAIRIRLQAAGYDVCFASDAYMGLREALLQKPDAMLLDISMPAGDGFSIVERLREHNELTKLPFIILTASKRPEFRKTAEELGAFAYFEKPFVAEEVLRAVNDAVGGRWALNLQ